MNDPGMLAAGWELVRRRWWHWLGLIQVPLLIVLGCYLAVVLANTTRFHYSFWNDPPPTKAADTFAVQSLWALAIVTSVVGFFFYGALCQFAIDLLHDPDSSASAAVGRSVTRGFSASWWGIPLFGLTAAATLLVIPGLVLVAIVAGLPLGFLVGVDRPLSAHRDWIKMAGSDPWLLGVIIEGTVVLSIIGGVFATQGLTVMASRFIPVFVFLAGWVAASAVGVVVSWAVVVLAMLRQAAPGSLAEG